MSNLFDSLIFRTRAGIKDLLKSFSRNGRFFSSINGEEYQYLIKIHILLTKLTHGLDNVPQFYLELNLTLFKYSDRSIHVFFKSSWLPQFINEKLGFDKISAILWTTSCSLLNNIYNFRIDQERISFFCDFSFFELFTKNNIDSGLNLMGKTFNKSLNFFPLDFGWMIMFVLIFIDDLTERIFSINFWEVWWINI